MRIMLSFGARCDCERTGDERLHRALAHWAMGEGPYEYIFQLRPLLYTNGIIFGVAAVLELGALFGALSAGVLADRYSRRHSICIACRLYHFFIPKSRS